MAERQQINKKRVKREEKKEEVSEQDFVAAPTRSSVMEKTDDLLDEIDALLEPLGEEIVRNFVQQGGQ